MGLAEIHIIHYIQNFKLEPMPSIIHGYEYDIFFSYPQKDNEYSNL